MITILSTVVSIFGFRLRRRASLELELKVVAGHTGHHHVGNHHVEGSVRKKRPASAPRPERSLHRSPAALHYRRDAAA
jgi:hypothetical protein